MKETIAKINKSKRLSLEKINKIDKPLAKLKPKKVRRLKLKKLEMKKNLQHKTQKYKGSQKSTMS